MFTFQLFKSPSLFTRKCLEHASGNWKHSCNSQSVGNEIGLIEVKLISMNNLGSLYIQLRNKHDIRVLT